MGLHPGNGRGGQLQKALHVTFAFQFGGQAARQGKTQPRRASALLAQCTQQAAGDARQAAGQGGGGGGGGQRQTIQRGRQLGNQAQQVGLEVLGQGARLAA